MSKFIVALTLPEFGSTPNSPSANFYKYYLRNHWLKVLNSSGVQRDVVLDRPLDGFVADNPPCLPITANDTVLTAFEKFQCIMDNLAIITGSMKAATPWTAEHTTTNNDQYQIGTIVYYMNSVYKCIAANDSIIPTNATYWQYLGVASGYYTQEQADWNATTGSSYIRNKPTIPPAPVQPDWTQTDNTQLDYIKNKPTNFGFDPMSCNTEIKTNILNSCSTPLHIQKDYSANVLIVENNNGVVGVNTTSPTAKVHIKGSTADSSAYSLKVQNSTLTDLLTVRNDGFTKVMDMTVGRGASLLPTNTAIGVSALDAVTTGGVWNTAIGYQALKLNTTGTENTTVGYTAGTAITTGNYNTLVGAKAGQVSTADWNTSIGRESMLNNSTGAKNTVVGGQALYNNTTGNYNTALGWQALKNSTASENTAVGYQADYYRTTGSYNTMVGWGAGSGVNASTTAGGNTGVGHSALFGITSGSNNTALGINSMSATVSGDHNVAVGANSMKGSVTGGHNFASGQNSMLHLTTGNHNIGIGQAVFEQLVSGSNNIGLGYQALNDITGTSDNIAIGQGAGTNCTGDRNIFIGKNAGGWQTSVTDRLFIHNKNVGSAASEENLSLITGTFDPNDDISLQKVQFNAVTTINDVLKLKPRSADPSSPSNGMIYYNSGSHKLRLYANGSWVDLN